MRVYSWDEGNIEHIARHLVKLAEAREVMEKARRPQPEYAGEGKWRVRGKTSSGRWLQVIYVYPDDDEVDPDSLAPADLIAYSDGRAQVVRVIHARNLTDDEKRQVRKRG